MSTRAPALSTDEARVLLRDPRVPYEKLELAERIAQARYPEAASVAAKWHAGEVYVELWFGAGRFMQARTLTFTARELVAA